MFFSENPEMFFSKCRIEIVRIPEPTGEGMEEVIIRGPIDQQLRDALRYIRNNVISEKVFIVPNQAEAIRVRNYSYEAIEEVLSNAVYHKSYQIAEPIVVRIEKDRIEITSAPGPDRSISDDDLKKCELRSRRYRNRRIGDFLKELKLIEGRNTGIPTAIAALKKNGSELPIFLTDEDRTYFSVIMKINNHFLQKSEEYDSPVVSKDIVFENIEQTIIDILSVESIFARKLYKELGHQGNPSKKFRSIVDDLIKKNMIKYTENSKNSNDNKLELVINKN